MESYNIDTYGRLWWDRFVNLSEEEPAATSCATGLKYWISDGPVLELGIGTGQVAYSLATMGIEVHGIDASTDMLKILNDRRRGRPVRSWCGDISNFAVNKRYKVIYAVGGVLSMLPNEQSKLNMFECVRNTLEPNGRLILEDIIPDTANFDNDELMKIERMDLEAVELLVARHFPSERRVLYRNVELSTDGVRVRPLNLQYSTFEKVDSLASHAGLRVAETFGGWSMTPHSPHSNHRVVTYTRM